MFSTREVKAGTVNISFEELCQMKAGEFYNIEVDVKDSHSGEEKRVPIFVCLDRAWHELGCAQATGYFLDELDWYRIWIATWRDDGDPSTITLQPTFAPTLANDACNRYQKACTHRIIEESPLMIN